MPKPKPLAFPFRVISERDRALSIAKAYLAVFEDMAAHDELPLRYEIQVAAISARLAPMVGATRRTHEPDHPAVKPAASDRHRVGG